MPPTVSSIHSSPPMPRTARQALLGIIERATERLALKAEAHRQRAEIQAELAADVLAFDDSPVGERLRRYELAHGRGVARALDALPNTAATPTDRSKCHERPVAEFDIMQEADSMTGENATNPPTPGKRDERTHARRQRWAGQPRNVEIDRQPSIECDRAGLARFVARPAEKLWQLHEENQRVANLATLLRACE